jgi:hypothetical protein
MRVTPFGLEPNPLPTTQRFDMQTGAPIAPPAVSTQHAAQRRGITMEAALLQAEHLAKRAAEAEDPELRAAADWCRNRSHQKILIELTAKVLKMEKDYAKR